MEQKKAVFILITVQHSDFLKNFLKGDNPAALCEIAAMLHHILRALSSL